MIARMPYDVLDTLPVRTSPVQLCPVTPAVEEMMTHVLRRRPEKDDSLYPIFDPNQPNSEIDHKLIEHFRRLMVRSTPHLLNEATVAEAVYLLSSHRNEMFEMISAGRMYRNTVAELSLDSARAIHYRARSVLNELRDAVARNLVSAAMQQGAEQNSLPLIRALSEVRRGGVPDYASALSWYVVIENDAYQTVQQTEPTRPQEAVDVWRKSVDDGVKLASMTMLDDVFDFVTRTNVRLRDAVGLVENGVHMDVAAQVYARSA